MLEQTCILRNISWSYGYLNQRKNIFFYFQIYALFLFIIDVEPRFEAADRPANAAAEVVD